MSDHPDLNLTQLFNPAATMAQVSQKNPTFIMLKTGDPIPPELIAALNVIPFIRDLRQIGMQRIGESEAQP